MIPLCSDSFVAQQRKTQNKEQLFPTPAFCAISIISSREHKPTNACKYCKADAIFIVVFDVFSLSCHIHIPHITPERMTHVYVYGIPVPVRCHYRLPAALRRTPHNKSVARDTRIKRMNNNAMIAVCFIFGRIGNKSQASNRTHTRARAYSGWTMRFIFPSGESVRFKFKCGTVCFR